MLRVILRSIQNTLVLSSALLVILALQRLQSFDIHHNNAEASPSWSHPEAQSYPEPLGGAEEPVFRLGSSHQIVLGHEFHVGLFRFVVPRLQRLQTSSQAVAVGQPQVVNNNNNNLRSQGWKIEGQNFNHVTTANLAYLVSFHSCDPQSIDAAILFQHSLSQTHASLRDFQLHALITSHATMDCAPILEGAGYHIATTNDTYDTFDATSCFHEETLALIVAHQLKADVVIRVPLPSVAFIPESNDMPVPNTEKQLIGFNPNDDGSQLQPQRTPSLTKTSVRNDEIHTSSNHGLVQILRPNRKRHSRQTMMEQILAQCHDNISDDASTLNSLPLLVAPWESATCTLGTCEIFKKLSIATFSACPMPWECESQETDKVTLISAPLSPTASLDVIASHCKTTRLQWLQLRRDWQNQNQHSFQDENSKEAVVTPIQLDGQYCDDSGKYVSMQL